MATGFQPPKNFAPPPGQNIVQYWREWKEKFELYMIVAKETKTDDEIKIGTLKYYMGPEWIKVAKTFKYDAVGDEKKYDIVMSKFNKHFEPKKLLKLYTTRFHQHIQGATESVTDYITAVRELGSHCEFGPLEDRMVCTKISNGVRDAKLKEKLWESDLDINTIIRKCNFFELSEDTKKLTREQATVHAASNAQRGWGRQRGHSRGRSRGRGRGQNQTFHQTMQQKQTSQRGHATRGRGSYVNNKPCQNCGYVHGERQCPAFRRYCNACGRAGHFSKMCRNKNVQFAEQADNGDNAMFMMDDYDTNYMPDVYDANYMPDEYDVNHMSEDFSAISVFTMIANDQVYMADKEFFVDLSLQDTQKMTFRIDTGAGTSIMSKHAYESLSVKPQLRKTNSTIRGVWESNVPVRNIVLPVVYKDQRFNIECQVIDSIVPNLLSANDSTRMNLVKRVYYNENDVMPGYDDVFSGIGRIPGEYSLPIDPQIPLVALNARPLPAALREATKNKLDELEAKDIIAKIPVGEPTPWCSALHVVPKKKSSTSNKMEVRITRDHQHLNKALKREYHPITTIEDVLPRTNGSTVFTCLDANQGYFQIGLDSASQKLTTFNSPFGRYMYKRLPMGIT